MLRYTTLHNKFQFWAAGLIPSVVFRNRKPTMLSQSLITQYGWPVFLNMCFVIVAV